MPVLTGSMEGDNPDSFNEGDLIIVNKATDESIAALEVGDIVTYVGNVGGARGFITHRIVDIEERRRRASSRPRYTQATSRASIRPRSQASAARSAGCKSRRTSSSWSCCR